MRWPDYLMLGSIPVAAFISSNYGDKIKAGKFWIFYFTCTLTLVVGFLILLISDKVKKNKIVKISGDAKWYVGIISLLLFLAGLVYAWLIYRFIKNDIEAKDTMVVGYETDYWLLYRIIMFSLGFIGAGIYLLTNRVIIEKNDNNKDLF